MSLYSLVGRGEALTDHRFTDGYAPQPQQLRLAITMPSTDGHAYDPEELAVPDPTFKFGVTTPYTTNGTGAAFFDTNETLPSAVDPHGPIRNNRPFQPRRKDSTVSGAGSDSGSSNTNVGRLPPQQSPPQHPPQHPLHAPMRKRDQTLRPATADSAMTDATDRTLFQSDDGKMAPSPISAPPNVAEARMKRLLNELDSIGLTDDMTIGRPSHDIDDWAASSSIGHGSTPSQPMNLPQRGPQPKFTRQEEIQRMQQMNQGRNWQPQNGAPPLAAGTRSPYTPNAAMHRNYPVDAPESMSPHSEPDDTSYYGSPVTPASGRMYPQQNRITPYSPQNASPVTRGMPPQQLQQGQEPAQLSRMNSSNFPIPNSSAFPMPPRSRTPTMQQQVSSPASRAPRRPGTAGNDPPVAFYNNTTGSNPANRSRFGSDQNLRERYLASGPQNAPSISSSQQSQIGLSPISPASAPAMTISSSGSRTNSVGSGALETPVDGNSPMVTNQPVQNGNLDSIREKEKEKEKTPSADLVITTPQAKTFNRAETSSTPTNTTTVRRGSLDTGLMLNTAIQSDAAREKGAKSPFTDLSSASPALAHNPFLGGGLSGGLMFGGLSWAMKEKEKGGTGDPPPYRANPSGSGTARSNSLRAGSVGGRSDASSSSFGDGIHQSRSDHSGNKKASSPAVALATAFVKEGVAGLSNGAIANIPTMSKAEKAAEKARIKAEKAAQKAEEARIKVEEEKDAKKNEAELKRKRKEEKVIKRLQVGEMGLYGVNGMVRFNA